MHTFSEHLETSPKKLLKSLSLQPSIIINDRGEACELVRPKRFVISEEIDYTGIVTYYFAAALTHVCDIEYNTELIYSKDICEMFDRLSGCQLVELKDFNKNKIYKIEKWRRKSIKIQNVRKSTSLGEIEYSSIFEVNTGCLLLELSVHSNGGGFPHRLVLILASNYLHESGFKYLPFERGGKLDKGTATKIFAKFNIDDINRFWRITRRTQADGIQKQSIDGELKAPCTWFL